MKRKRRPSKTEEPRPQAPAPEPTALVHELLVHQEELRTQNEALQQTRNELEVSRDRYLELFDLAPVAYVTTSRRGIIEQVNFAGQRLLGRGRTRLVGMPLVNYAVERERRRFLDLLHGARTSDEVTSLELTMSGERGEILVQLIVRPGIESLQIVLHDKSEQQRALEQQARFEHEQRRLKNREVAMQAAAQAKDRFLAMLSHELRTPLMPILTAVSGLVEHVELPQDVRALLEMIRRNVHVETRLIDDLLDMNRIEHGKLNLRIETVDVHQLIEEAVKNAAPSPANGAPAIVLDLHARASRVRGDRLRLQQVLWNLLGNARRHTPAEGTITVRTDDEEGRIRVAVTDTGRGIAPEQLASLFAPFRQGEWDSAGDPQIGSGLGLGLAICKGIVEAHSGSISARSAGAGRGATFEFLLRTAAIPLEKKAAKEAQAPAETKGSSEPAPPRLRILLVEDHADSAAALALFLRRVGHEVAIAHTYAEAVRLGGFAPDVLISDVDLPDGSGLELVARLQHERPLAAIALSGHGGTDMLQQSERAGFHEHLVKPVEMRALLESVRRVVRRHPTGNGRSHGAAPGS